MENGPDEEMRCWLQFKEGDREAFATIYRQNILSLIAYGLRLCSDRDLLKDQIQELFVELWHSRRNLAATGSVKFYLFKALRYKLIRLEKSRMQRDQFVRIAMHAGNGYEDSAEDRVIDKEIHASQVASLREAIKTLPIRQQEVIQLRYYQGFTHDQIAELMELNYQSVSNLLHRALSRLKKAADH